MPTPLPAPAVEPAPWTEYLGTVSRAPSAKEHLAAEPARLWSASVGRATAGAPAVGDSLVIVQEIGGRLVALARLGGRRVWQRRLGGPGSASPLLDSQAVIAATGGKSGAVHLVTLPHGDIRWSRTVGPVADPMAAFDGRIFAATEEGRIVGLDRSRGSVLWRRTLPAGIRSGLTPIPHGLAVIAGDSLYLLSPDDGGVRAAAPVPGPTLAPPAATVEALIVGFPDGLVAAFHLPDLRELWRVGTGGPVVSAPAIARDTVFVTTLDGQLWQIPLHHPERARARDLGVPMRASPAPFTEGVLVVTTNGEVLWMAGDSGAPRWQIRLDGPIEQPPLVRDGALVVVDGRGRVHVWH